MASKPFIAARIPENLNLKLEEHSKATGEGKTQALINALSAYLGIALEDKSKENADDRLSLLEKKVAELERLLKEPQQISLLDTSAMTEKKTAAKEKHDNNIDNKADNSLATPDNELDNEFDNRDYILTHAEVAEQTGMQLGSVRNAHSKKKPITRKEQGRRYVPEQKNAWIVEIL